MEDSSATGTSEPSAKIATRPLLLFWSSSALPTGIILCHTKPDAVLSSCSAPHERPSGHDTAARLPRTYFGASPALLVLRRRPRPPGTSSSPARLLCLRRLRIWHWWPTRQN